MTKAPEPKDELDAATAVVGAVNRPEDVSFDWRQIDWRRVEADVRRLRQRIFMASKAGDLASVRSLQKWMLRFALQHAFERAAGDRAQRWSSDGTTSTRAIATCSHNDGRHTSNALEPKRQATPRGHAVAFHSGA
jgi:hypothetical protein